MTGLDSQKRQTNTNSVCMANICVKITTEGGDSPHSIVVGGEEHLNMEDSFATDDFNLYFEWKIKTERDIAPGDPDEHRKKQKVAKHEDAKYTRKATIEKVHMPTSRQVEVVKKWRELEEADKGLHAMRAKYEEKIEEFSTRWRQIEDRQTLLKSNLVKYNNFVKEKQGKVADGLSRAILQKNKQVRLREEEEDVETEWEVLIGAKEVLAVALKEKEVYNDFLDSVVRIAEDDYANKNKLIERCEALADTR